MKQTSQRNSDFRHAPREFIEGAMVAGKGLFMKRLINPGEPDQNKGRRMLMEFFIAKS